MVYLNFENNDIKVLPNPFQLLFELIFFSILKLIIDNLRKTDVNFFSLIIAIFLLILGLNLLGVFPYTFAVTGHLFITFSFAFCIFLGLNIVGFRLHGSNMLGLLLPQGIAVLISSLLISIEFISYNFRVISLSVRLFANIMAGHTLLLVINTFNFFLVKCSSKNILLLILSPSIVLIPVCLVLALVVLELGVAMIQGYVFTLLSIMYTADAKYLH